MSAIDQLTIDGQKWMTVILKIVLHMIEVILTVGINSHTRNWLERTFLIVLIFFPF